jgi:hypothetical protein
MPSQGMPMIDKFNTDPDVYIFLISTLAGGTGLNLTGKLIVQFIAEFTILYVGANKVVIFGTFWRKIGLQFNADKMD